MNDKPQFTISPGAIQDTLFAALRILTVLLTGGTAILGFIGKRDLAGLVAYIQSSDFTPVAAALAAIATAAYGLYQTNYKKRALLTVKASASTIVPDDVLSVKGSSTVPPGALSIPVLFLLIALPATALLSACATLGGDVRLNANKAFYTAQIALKSTQQTTLALCSAPRRPLAACNKAIDLLNDAAKAEAAGFTAQQTGNAADLQAAVTTLTALPSQLAALGILEAR